MRESIREHIYVILLFYWLDIHCYMYFLCFYAVFFFFYQMKEHRKTYNLYVLRLSSIVLKGKCGKCEKYGKTLWKIKKNSALFFFVSIIFYFLIFFIYNFSIFFFLCFATVWIFNVAFLLVLLLNCSFCFM